MPRHSKGILKNSRVVEYLWSQQRKSILIVIIDNLELIAEPPDEFAGGDKIQIS